MTTETIIITTFFIGITTLKIWVDKKSNLRNNLLFSLTIFLISTFWIGFLTNDLINNFSMPKVFLIALFTYSLFENYYRRLKNHQQS